MFHLGCDTNLQPHHFFLQDERASSPGSGQNTVSLIVGGKTLYLFNLYDPENPIELAFQVSSYIVLKTNLIVKYLLAIYEWCGLISLSLFIERYNLTSQMKDYFDESHISWSTFSLNPISDLLSESVWINPGLSLVRRWVHLDRVQCRIFCRDFNSHERNRSRIVSG